MRILIYGINFSPELTGIGKYTGEMAEWLSSKGNDVCVITAPPYYPEWEIKKGYSSLRYRFEKINGMQVWRCPLWIPTKKNGPNRILHLLSFAISSFFILFKFISWKPEVIITVEPSFFCTPATLLFAKFAGAKTWLHIQDFEIDAALGMGFLSSGKIFSLVKAIEGKILRQFDRVSTISGKMMEKLQKRVCTEKSVLFPNWVDTNKIYPLYECDFFRKKWHIDKNTTVVLYSGNMGKKQGLDTIIEVASRMKDKVNIQFVLCGEGVYKDKLEALAKGLNNIRFLQLQPVERFNQLLNTADIHLLPQSADAEDLVMPSKLTGILSCGGIVIATTKKNTELADTVLKAGGFISPPGDYKKIITIINTLSENSETQTKLRSQAREYTNKHLRKNDILTNFYKNLQNCIK